MSLPANQIEHLLSQIEKTKLALTREIQHKASELEFISLCNDRLFVNELEAIVKTNDDACEDKLKALLARRWEDIKDSGEAYCDAPHLPINQLCYATALACAPLPEDLDDCDDWEVGEGPYFLLMPGLTAHENIDTDNIHRFQLQQFILSEDRTRFIPVFETLRQYYFNEDKTKPIHTVFNEEHPYHVNDPLSAKELKSLRHHSPLTVEIMELIDFTRNPESSFYFRLLKLAEGLRDGSVAGSGEEKNAGAEANAAIVEFFAYWDMLGDEIQEEYLRILPDLRETLQRIKDPVSIHQQGVVYCAQITSSNLKRMAQNNKDALQGKDLSALVPRIKPLLDALEKRIKSANYPLNFAPQRKKPNLQQLLALKPAEQRRLLREEFKLDYPNFLVFGLNHQKALIDDFIQALEHSPHRSELLLAENIFHTINQRFPEHIPALLGYYAELPQDKLYEALTARDAKGQSFIDVILYANPQNLPILVTMLSKLLAHELQKLLIEKPGLLPELMTNNEAAFIALCKTGAKLPGDNLFLMFSQNISEGQSQFAYALKHIPEAEKPLMTLWEKFTPQQKTQLLMDGGLLTSALRTDANSCAAIFEFAETLAPEKRKALFANKSLLTEVSQCPAHNFDTVLKLLEKDAEVEALLAQVDDRGNNLLMQAILYQPEPVDALRTLLSKLPPKKLFPLLTQINTDGASAFTLAVTQGQTYLPMLLELTEKLGSKAKKTISRQSQDKLPLALLAAQYAPKFYYPLCEKLDIGQDEKTLANKNHKDETQLQLISEFSPETIDEQLHHISSLPKPKRYKLLMESKETGYLWLNAVAENHPDKLLKALSVIQGMSLTETTAILNPKSEAELHLLVNSLSYGINCFDMVLGTLCEQIQKEPKDILSQLPIKTWFELLSHGMNQVDFFKHLYADFKTWKKDELAQLLLQTNSAGDTLLMLAVKNNPAFLDLLWRDVRDLGNEKIQRQIMKNKNTHEEDFLQLCQRSMRDSFVMQIQNYLKRIDKESHQAMLKKPVKMHCNSDLIVEMLEIDDAKRLYKALQNCDAKGNNRLGQIVLETPHRFSELLSHTEKYLSKDEIATLLKKQNTDGLNSYWLAARQPQAGYLCQQLMRFIDGYSNEVQLQLLAAIHEIPEALFAIGNIGARQAGLVWLSRHSHHFNQWHHYAKPFGELIQAGDAEGLTSLLKYTRTMDDDQLKTLLANRLEAVQLALNHANPVIKKNLYDCLYRLPQNLRFEILKQLNAETLLLIADEKAPGLLDSLRLEQKSALMSITNERWENIVYLAMEQDLHCARHLISTLQNMPFEMQADIFASSPKMLLLFAEKEPLKFERYLEKIKTLPPRLQQNLLNKPRDGRRFINLFRERPDDYQKVLRLISQVNVRTRADILMPLNRFSHSILLTAPDNSQHTMFALFFSLPGFYQQQVLLEIHNKNPEALINLLDQNPEYQCRLLSLIQSLSDNDVTSLFVESEQYSLFSWLIKQEDPERKAIAVDLLSRLKPDDVYQLLTTNPEFQVPQIQPGFVNDDEHIAIDNYQLLHVLAKEERSVYNKSFELLKTLPQAYKIDILNRKNGEDINLLGLLYQRQLPQEFQRLCDEISQLPSAEKWIILKNSRVFPIEKASGLFTQEAAQLQKRNFIALLNNKQFSPAVLSLINTLPPKQQIALLSQRKSPLIPLIDEVVEPERSLLRLQLQQAKSLASLEDLLENLYDIVGQGNNNAETRLYQSLKNHWDHFQQHSKKDYQATKELVDNFQREIETERPQIQTGDLGIAEIVRGIFNLCACLLLPFYGIQQLKQKVTSNRNVLFYRKEEKISDKIEDCSNQIEEQSKQLCLQADFGID